MIIASHGHSDVGFVREKNEDSFLFDDHKGIYAVADGVGGLPFGALASKLAVQFYNTSVHDLDDCTTEHELRVLAHSIHHNIVECGTIVGGENGIGCTFSGLRQVGDKMVFVHVGDSSIYLQDESGIKKVSKCHTLGDELIDKHGPEAAIDMPEHYMHTLTRCMGQDIDFEVDIGEISLIPGRSILICSDGITNMVELPEIERMLNEMDPKSFVHSVIDLANQNGGTDNSTAVCIKIS
ncbi:protein phosphatase 2C domain-containing protein [Opitutales bacterium]|jgi:protein phosphatase|nr:protein phosphatase 2C domain-containing protein [Opitutales bacterium]